VHLVERRFEAVLRTPLSVRKAMAVIVSATLVSVIVGGFLITVVDPEEFPDLGTGLWWALQTVTTVGYGDVTPEHTVGRLVGALIMLEAIAFVAIVIAGSPRASWSGHGGSGPPSLMTRPRSMLIG
jgi:voltage-gated potassium channel